jgi:hypothetical protein
LALETILRTERFSGLGKDLMIKGDLEVVNEPGPDIFKVTCDVGHAAVCVEYFLVLPLLDKCYPAGVIRTLVQFIPQAALLLVSRLDKRVKCIDQFFCFPFNCMELCNANNPRFVKTIHVH